MTFWDEFFPWLVFVVVFLGAIGVPAAIGEFSRPYRRFLRHQKAKKAWEKMLEKKLRADV
jgi:hypothetical protein